MYSSQAYCVDKKLSIIIAIFASSFVISVKTANGETNDYCAQTEYKPFKNEIKYEDEEGWQEWIDFNHEYYLINHKTQKSKSVLSKPFTYPENLIKKYNEFLTNATGKRYKGVDIDSGYEFHVKRSTIVEGSYQLFSAENAPIKFKQKLWISLDENKYKYLEEEFLRTEWFWLLSTEISKKYFQSDADDKNNHQLEINPEFKDLKRFEFIGRVIGAAIYHQVPINMNFVEPYYKIMLGDKTREEKLISVENQMCALLKGFADFIPLQYLRIFSSTELQTAIGGRKVTDNEWNRMIIKKDEKFAKAVNTFNEEEREQFVQYVTGSPRIPFTKSIYIGKLHMEEVAENDLPEVNHLYERIKVCNKWSAEEMAKKIKMAMQKATNYELEASVKSPN